MHHRRGRPEPYWLFIACVAFSLLPAGCRSLDVGPNDPPSDGGGSVRPTSRYSFRVHYVMAGETLYSIGAQHGVMWQLIKEQNHLDSDVLEVNQILLIPILAGPDAGGAESAPPVPVPQQAGQRVGGSGASRNGWSWPLSGHVIREYGGILHGLPEPGIAISAPVHTPVRAVADGVVISIVQRPARMTTGWGNVIAVRHGSDMVSWYAHLNSVRVGEGDRVKRGDIIGAVGQTGAADRSQLAFRLFSSERPVNPQWYLP